jgi:hypothetical protein
MTSLQTRFAQAFAQGTLAVEEFCQSLEACCVNFCQRLSHEEELVRIAERVMPSEAWFGFAASALSQQPIRISSRQLIDDEV